MGGCGHAMEYEIFRILYSVSRTVAVPLQEIGRGGVFFLLQKKANRIGSNW